MKYHIHHLSCFDNQVRGLDKKGKELVKEALGKMRDGETARDTISDDGTIRLILAGTGVDKSAIGLGMLEFNLTGHWRIFAYKTGPWTKTTEVKDKFGKPAKGVEALKTVYDGTYWPVKIGHLESGRCKEPAPNALG
ncbi:hypothetical protein [Falsiroseomonas oryziterrae]|uniref:hypothetical protein n=1 Tax=Falsiroseomonas oryziterrae TaxID=2911368 RepID=UPI001F16B5BE|nr:hypothetical protein [Roseomonas sp. NPKOSM-4]